MTSNPGASKAAISLHYDLSNEFFRLFLDRELCYSCAMYDNESDSFEEAQERKSSTTFTRVPMELPASSTSDVVGARCKRGWSKNTARDSQ
jgi:cyclopropane fatty-acyl-phospholipid synthase-like methyltransferase